MRLWTQARLMGTHAAACMAGADETEVFNFSFELVSYTVIGKALKVRTVCSWAAEEIITPRAC
jgi:hypothetical protein